MTSEFNLHGVYLSSALVTALIASLVSFVLRKLLLRAGFYEYVWHRNLVDIALFTLVWAAVAFAASRS